MMMILLLSALHGGESIILYFFFKYYTTLSAETTRRRHFIILNYYCILFVYCSILRSRGFATSTVIPRYTRSEVRQSLPSRVFACIRRVE